MIWLNLIWYWFWRGLLYGGISGTILGTLFSPFDGTIYGVIIGTILGAVLGLINGILLTIMTHLCFPLPIQQPRYVGAIRITITPIDFIVVFIYLMSAVGYIAIIPAALVGIMIFSQSARFAAYAILQLTNRTSNLLTSSK
jgi:hypothetical protein